MLQASVGKLQQESPLCLAPPWEHRLSRAFCDCPRRSCGGCRVSGLAWLGSATRDTSLSNFHGHTV